MPSMASPPEGTIPSGHDVKTFTSSSKVEEQTQSEAQVTAATKAPKEAAPGSKEPEVEESDLEALEEQKKVPYGRFKEKVDETKLLKQQLEQIKRDSDLARLRAEEDAELRVKARLDKEREAAAQEDLDPVERTIRANSSEVQNLRSELSQMRAQADHERTQARIDRLSQKYPEADSLAVLGWAQASGVKANSDKLEDLMEKSHNDNVDRAQRAVRQILEHKKAKAKTAVPTREGGIRLKDGDRPKSMKEAAALSRRYLTGDGGD